MNTRKSLPKDLRGNAASRRRAIDAARDRAARFLSEARETVLILTGERAHTLSRARGAFQRPDGAVSFYDGIIGMCAAAAIPVFNLPHVETRVERDTSLSRARGYTWAFRLVGGADGSLIGFFEEPLRGAWFMETRKAAFQHFYQLALGGLATLGARVDDKGHPMLSAADEKAFFDLVTK